MSHGAHLVVGPGHEAGMVAATLAATGATVTLVRTAPGLPPELACARGATWRAEPEHAAIGARVHGPTTPATSVAVGVFVAGAPRVLPLEPWTMGAILPTGHRRSAARSWLRARARNALSVVVGGGQEERTYRDWVVRRMGAPAYDLLYADYAERRWGRQGDHLSASLARVAHSPALATSRVQPTDVRDHGAERTEALLSTLGVEVHASEVRRFHIQGKRIGTVELADTFLDTTDHTVWSTLSPAQTADCLGADCPPTARHLAASLGSLAAGRVRLSHARSGIGDELHILDPAPCWRFVRAPDAPDHWLVSFTGSPSSATLEDIRDFAVQGGLVDSGSRIVASGALPGGEPVWGPVDHARLRTVLDTWRPLGLHSTGSAGTLTPLDPTSLVAHVQHLLKEGAGGLQEAWRTIAAPPTRVDDLGARITHFFAATQ